MRAVYVGVAIAVAALAVRSSAQVAVSVDRSVRYQTIEGFGASGTNMKPWKVSSGPFLVDVDLDSAGFYDTVLSELGVTMLRIYSDGGIEQTPGEIDNPEKMSRDFHNIRRFVEASERQNEPLRFITSSWSPPAWTKVNDSLACGFTGGGSCSVNSCRLKTGMEDEVADYFVRYMRLLEDSAGIAAYALGIQNEPAFREPYASCVFCPTGYRDLLKVVGARFRQERLTTRFYGAEHMSWDFGNFERAIRADAEALSYMHAWAVHGYTDGIETDTGAYSGSSPSDKPLWMSETSGGGYGETLRDWPGGITTAKMMLSYLRDGRITAWTWWSLSGSTTEPTETWSGSKWFLMVNGQGNDKYYVSSHFFRYIRPGARQIQSASDNSAVKVVAFYHEANDCMTIVLLNTGAATTVSGIGGANVPATFEKITSTSAAKLQRSTVASNEAISLPDSSITTLVAGAYRGTGTIDDTPITSRPSLQQHGLRAPANAVRVNILTLDGRRVGIFDASAAATPKRLPMGTYVRAFVDTHGRIVQANRLTVEGR